MIKVNLDTNDAALDEFKAALLDRVNKVCYAIEARAKELVPAESGELRRSITTDTAINGDQITGYVGSVLDYAPYVHEGTGIYSRTGHGRQQVPWTFYDLKTGEYRKTSGIPSTPFLEDAITQLMPQIQTYLTGGNGNE